MSPYYSTQKTFGNNPYNINPASIKGLSSLHLTEPKEIVQLGKHEEVTDGCKDEEIVCHFVITSGCESAD